MTVASTIAMPTDDNSASADQADLSPGCAMRGETLTQAPELVKRQHNLSEHAAHPRAREPVDGEHAGGGDRDEDHAERRRLVGAARDVEGEDADGDRLPAAEREKEHRRRLLQR